MRLVRIEVTNFRCFRSETIELENYTAFVGPNNSGKSTLFKAVDIFFRSTQKTHPFVLSDFGDPKKELQIILSFAGLSEDAQKQFSHYARHGILEFFIRAKVIDGRVEASIHGRRMGIPGFALFHQTDGATAQKEVYAKVLRQNFSDLPEVPAKAAVGVYRDALAQYESEHQEQHEMIESEDLAFGASGVASRLKKYVDWVYIPAVKDAADEEEEAKNNAFGTLVNRIIRARVKVDEKVNAIRAAAHDKIRELVGDYKDQVRKLEDLLDSEFRRITSTDAHVRLDWAELTEGNVDLNLPLVRSILQDNTFQGEISKFGHGLQRNYLVTLVHLNAKLLIEDQPSIILAIEEPELYQHPPQAKFLHTALEDISQQDQVLVTTHSPYFISCRNFDKIRVVRKNHKDLSTVTRWSVEEHRRLVADLFGEEAIGQGAALASLEPFLQPELNESFFCSKLVLVEGPEDKALLHAALTTKGSLKEFARAGAHVVSASGKGSLINMIALARGFKTPLFLMFDADTDCDAGDREKSRVLNEKLARLLGKDTAKYAWPAEDIFDHDSIVWKANIQEAINLEHVSWYDEVRAICAAFGWRYDRLKKNPIVVSRAFEIATQSGKTIKCLDRAADSVLKFALS